jgi:hypothetical protein
LPAQFVSLLSDAHVSKGEKTGLAIKAAKSRTKVLLFMAGINGLQITDT